jgi:peptidoglycan hydrolase-like protein with peptidoglycan-binding domain
VWGSPDLKPLTDRGVHLIASDYPGAKGTGVAQYLADGGDGGPGWASYGGMTPVMWQYTDAAAEQGQLIDFNAFRGTAAQLADLLGEPVTVATASTTGAHRTLMLGSGGDDVRAVQTLLSALHFDTQGTDGQFGLKTLAAVEHAQGAWHITKDGKVGPHTYASLHQALRTGLELRFPAADLALGATGWNVQILQSCLWLLGYDPAGIDAHFGQHTRAAVIAFQEAVGIGQDGEAGPETFAKLRG